ncbi:hypothetical protein CMU66_18360 [Elizabethkingia anophelis]|uniref:hypothetical protein n=1 Tax=Weeksellaceae TaxID=2762318 RepID=UPI00099ACE94|nr:MULTISPECIES: hypothetical protein [Weeksellaceae]MDV3550282.1 hypothetical protein [Elizabethkingia anophelis]MDV3565207.1 hypothetical protein [Elizabethkingia anophelis]MDV3612211.1 hypothetical protein [Elizabethkingia anophelis]MDV3626651.1 hypothetical protein [Elizabethkingia anophelis]MDV3644296.1 hypothetical protein [Elizabethkingia anophelis]
MKQQINIAKKFSGAEGTNASYNSIFIVNSLAKTIKAMIALNLVRLGKWNFNETIYKYTIH